jgi:23S rRNA pseudouridine1911/1915/1917 synthase
LLALKYGEDMSPTLVHRLDSETSGIVLCAKTRDAERAGKMLFEKREVKKEYKAIVRGIVNPPDGCINLPLSPDPTTIIKARMWCKTEDGLPSLTEYETISRGKNHTFLRLMPKTGRQHQLRVHLDHIGHTIVGDKLYGPDRDIFIDYMQDGLTDDIIRRAGHTRHALHAYKLQIMHPFTEKKLIIEAPMPQDMWDLLDKHL